LRFHDQTVVLVGAVVEGQLTGGVVIASYRLAESS
jgi:hypothetical protein